jgi:hypothetical protein
MRTCKLFLLLITASIITSFSAPREINWDDLEGKWISKGYNYDNGTDIYVKVKDLPPDKGGYQFDKDGTLTVKQNSGWCGTPPVHYQTVTGIWKKVNDSVIHIEHRNWRGSVSKDLQVISLSKTEMAFKNYTKK